MQAVFIGGIKSGKSKNAEEYTLKHSKDKPFYLATTEFFDEEMESKVKKHKLQRGSGFTTIEEALNLSSIVLKHNAYILVECVSMWINNMLYHKHTEKDMMQELEKLRQTKHNFVFVINDVSCSVVSENSLTRSFVDINGRIAQYLASHCKEVFNIVAGISVKIK